MERTEEHRCRVLWLMGLSSSSLSREAKLRAFRNLQEEQQEEEETKVRGGGGGGCEGAGGGWR